MHTLVGKWIPPNERGKFASAYMGNAIGAAVFLPGFGLLISLSSWEWAYYVSTIIGMIWFLCWHLLIFESPEHHPCIDPRERDYIHQSLGTSVQQHLVHTFH